MRFWPMRPAAGFLADIFFKTSFWGKNPQCIGSHYKEFCSCAAFKRPVKKELVDKELRLNLDHPGPRLAESEQRLFFRSVDFRVSRVRASFPV